eukprot:scaffold126616_cov19-Prasinocladus_malaysianus.AAC.1
MHEVCNSNGTFCSEIAIDALIMLGTENQSHQERRLRGYAVHVLHCVERLSIVHYVFWGGVGHLL